MKVKLGYRKITAGSLAGAATVILGVISKEAWGYTFTAELQGAVTTLVMALLVFFTPEHIQEVQDDDS